MSHRGHDRPRSQGRNGKKRKHEQRGYDGMGHTLSLLRQPELPEFNLTSARTESGDQDQESPKDDQKSDLSNGADDWQTIENGRPTKKAKKIPKVHSSNYPSIKFSPDSRLQSQIKISDIQNLVLYILADGPSPQFVSVRHRPEIRKVVVLMVPGLEKSMFVKETENNDGRRYSPDDYYPVRLQSEEMPYGLEAFADMFEDLWPVKTPGDDKFGKMHSPLHAILTAPLPKNKDEKDFKINKKGAGVKQAREPAGWKNSRTPISEFVHTAEELLENDYTLHPAVYDSEGDKTDLASHRTTNGVSAEHGWVDTLVKTFEDGTTPDDEIEHGSLTAGREVLAMDCEMCMTGENEFSLTRISIVGWDGSVVLDELVKPAKPITNYLTQYSGISEKMLESVTTTLQDIQQKLVSILNPRTILIGHSLNSDLNALKLTHPFIIDTALIYPHPRGPPLKSSLKWLAQKYLSREIQKGHGTTGPGAGHDSIEDARTCLDLVKQKCEKGKEWGTSDAAGENIFKRVARAGVKYKNQGGSAIPSPINGKSSAMVDWGDPKKGAGAAATYIVGCKSDEDVVDGVIRAVRGDHDGKHIPGGGVDFVFGRLRELEALKGWWNNNKSVTPVEKPTEVEATSSTLVPTVIPALTMDASSIEKADAPAQEATQSSIVDAVVKNNVPADPTADAAAALVEVHPKAHITALEAPEVSAANFPIKENPLITLAEANEIPEAIEIPEASQPEINSGPALSSSALPPSNLPDTPLVSATSSLTSRLRKIYDALPPCTAFVIYSGSGDPREMSRLQAMQTQFKKEYKIKKWDQLSVKWTDTEEQALKRAVRDARNGIAFMGVR